MLIRKDTGSSLFTIQMAQSDLILVLFHYSSWFLSLNKSQLLLITSQFPYEPRRLSRFATVPGEAYKFIVCNKPRKRRTARFSILASTIGPAFEGGAWGTCVDGASIDLTSSALDTLLCHELYASRSKHRQGCLQCDGLDVGATILAARRAVDTQLYETTTGK